jgi:hypothetical protein
LKPHITCADSSTDFSTSFSVAHPRDFFRLFAPQTQTLELGFKRATHRDVSRARVVRLFAQAQVRETLALDARVAPLHGTARRQVQRRETRREPLRQRRRVRFVGVDAKNTVCVFFVVK